MKDLDLLRDVILNEFKNGAIQKLLHKALVKGAIDREIIETNEHTRGIGKTTALINFASQFDYAVVVPGEEQAKQLRSTFNYEHIFGEYQFHTGKLRGNNIIHNGIVIDENVSLLLISTDYKTITGYHYNE